MNPKPNYFNIPDSIWNAANAYPNLDGIAMGGGCDYIIRKFPSGVTLALSAENDAGSPYKLEEPCSVTIFPKDDWQEGTTLTFKNVPTALAFMAETGNCHTFGLDQQPTKERDQLRADIEEVKRKEAEARSKYNQEAEAAVYWRSVADALRSDTKTQESALATLRANKDTFQELITDALTRAGAPTHHPETNAPLRKPMMPQERIAYLATALSTARHNCVMLEEEIKTLKHPKYADHLCAECSRFLRPLKESLAKRGAPTGADNWPLWATHLIQMLSGFELSLGRYLRSKDDKDAAEILVADLKHHRDILSERWRVLTKEFQDNQREPTPTQPQPQQYLLMENREGRRYDGNCAIWWKPGGAGYTTWIDNAGRYTAAEAERHRNYPDLVTIVPLEIAESTSYRVCDHNTVKHELLYAECLQKFDEAIAIAKTEEQNSDAETEAFNLAKRLGWDAAEDPEFSQWGLKATALEIAEEGKARVQKQFASRVTRK